MYIDMKMIEGGFQLQRAAADVLSNRLDRDRCLLVQEFRRLVDDPSRNADFSSQYRPARLFTAGKQSLPDQELMGWLLGGIPVPQGQATATLKALLAFRP